MVTSKRVHTGLVDVFYGSEGWESNQWVRCSYGPEKGWKFISRPTKAHQLKWPIKPDDREIEFGAKVDLHTMLDAIHNHLVSTYGKRGNK